MRLDPETIPPLLRAVRETFGGDAEIWLFGSRTDDAKRGGDIDLYVETDVERDIVIRRSKLLRQLEEIFGDRKIDLAVRPRSRRLHPLYVIAREEGVLLSEDMRLHSKGTNVVNSNTPPTEEVEPIALRTDKLDNIVSADVRIDLTTHRTASEDAST